MDLNEYQKEALVTAKDSGEFMRDLNHYAHGVSDEAGEVAGAIKKYLREDYGGKELNRRLQQELGDTLWYIAVLADFLNIPLESVARKNIEKLRDRDERGVIKGDGDDR